MPLSQELAESVGWRRKGVNRPCLVSYFFTLFILCFLMINVLYVAKELMSHKVYNFISSWLFLFFPGGCISFLSASLAWQDVLCL